MVLLYIYGNENSTLISNLCSTAYDSKKFKDRKTAEKVSKCLEIKNTYISQFCPSCKEEFEGHPAISRKDNKTEICSRCGTMEALKEYFDNKK